MCLNSIKKKIKIKYVCFKKMQLKFDLIKEMQKKFQEKYLILLWKLN